MIDLELRGPNGMPLGQDRQVHKDPMQTALLPGTMIQTAPGPRQTAPAPSAIAPPSPSPSHPSAALPADVSLRPGELPAFDPSAPTVKVAPDRPQPVPTVHPPMPAPSYPTSPAAEAMRAQSQPPKSRAWIWWLAGGIVAAGAIGGIAYAATR